MFLTMMLVSKAGLESWYQATNRKLWARPTSSLLSMIATVVAMRLWGRDGSNYLHVCYGDNDSVRFSLIRAVGTGDIGFSIMKSHREWEAESNCQTWFARVPTEANIADYPSRLQKVEILTDELCCNDSADTTFKKLLEKIKLVEPY